MSEADHTEQPHVLPRRTTPTWEVELLISGVAVFAMLQLPGWLDDRMFALEPRVGGDWQMTSRMVYFYAKSAAIVLAVTFALHLLLRAHWIALVGMHSVFPKGVRLDRLRMGPIQRAIEEANPDSDEDAIERADNRASVVFAIGVSVALLIGSICLFFCGALVLALLLANAAGWQVNPVNFIAAGFAVFILPFAIAAGIDHARAGRLQPGGRAYRAIESILRFYARIGMGRRNNRIIAILTSNGGERRVMALVIGIMMTTIVGVASAYAAMRGKMEIGAYALFPDAGPTGIDPAHYEDQRDLARDDAAPYVQSMAIAGPYLRLVVPYKPRRDERAMRACPAPRGDDKADRANALLACMQALRAVALDGKPIPGLRYEVGRDPHTDLLALVAIIDIRALPPGRHELRIAHPLRDPDGKRDDDDPGYELIAFWH